MADKKILIVEDEYIIAMELKMTLEDLGYDICGIINKGEDVLPLVEKYKPNLILMDITLKGEMTGIDAAKTLYKKHYDTPIIYCSAEINKERLEKIKIPNTYGFMIKPIREDNLYTTIELGLEKARLEEELENTNEELMRTNEELEEINEELEQTNEQLEKLKNRYSKLFLSSIDGICLHKLVYDENNKPINYKIIDVNPHYEKILGLKKENVINKLSTEAYNINEPPYLDIYSKVAITGEPNIFVTYFEPMDKYFLISVFSTEKGKFATSFRDITEQKKAELELKESEAKFKSYIENAPIGVFVADSKGNYIEVNKTACDTTGYTENELKSKNLIELIAPDSVQATKKHFETLVNTGISKGESNFIKKDGSKRSWIVDAVKISKNRYIGFTRDITEKEQLSEKLELTKTTIDNSNYAVFWINKDGSFFYANKNACKSLNYDLDELLKLKVNDVDPNYPMERRKEFWNKIKTEKSNTMRTIHKDKNGNTIPVEVSNFYISYKNNEYEVAMARDITDIIKMEQEIYEDENKLSIIFNNNTNPMILWRVDKDNGIKLDIVNDILFNSLSIIDFNITKENLTGKSLEDIMNIFITDSTKKSEIKSYFYKAILEKEETNYLETFALNNKTYHVQIKLIPILDNNGNCIYLLFRGHDISEQLEKEKELRETKEKYRLLAVNSSDIIMMWVNGELKYISPSVEAVLGYTADELLRTNFIDLLHPKDRDKTINTIRYRVENNILDSHTYEYRHKHKNGGYRWVQTISKRKKVGNDIISVVNSRDITNLKQANEQLENIKWMLENKKPEDLIQKSIYDDPTEINTERLILDSVGKDFLKNIMNDYLELLETSSAVYEKNGDYAYGIFCSHWCSFLDNASYKLCETNDLKEALNCGKWLCHESCWNDDARKIIETGRPVDIECAGGIRMYGVPIFLNDKVIGAVNLGYGDPPTDSVKLKEIAEKYNVDFEELKRIAGSYRSRPKYIIDFAKERLKYSALLIGEIVFRKQQEKRLIDINSRVEALINAIPDMIFELDKNGTYLYFKAPKSELYIQDEETIIDKNHRNILPKDFIELSDYYIKKALETKELQTFEYSLVIPDKGLNYYEARMAPHGSEKVIAIVRNITEKKMAEKKIKDSELKLKSILNNTLQSFILIGRDYKIIEFNNNPKSYAKRSPTNIKTLKIIKVIFFILLNFLISYFFIDLILIVL